MSSRNTSKRSAAIVGIAVNPVTHNVYVANYNAASVTPITGCPSACAAGTALTAGTNPSALTVNPTTGDVYVADSGNAAFTVIANGGTRYDAQMRDLPRLDEAQLVTKFVENATPRLGAGAAALADRILRVEELPRAAELLSL